VPEDEWFTSMASNDVVYLNVSRLELPNERGFFTYILHPGDCTAGDFQYFGMYDDPDASPRLIGYLQSLADGRSLPVCLSVCRSREPAKAAEAIEMPFGLWARVGSRNHVLDGGLDPHATGQFCGRKGATHY